MFLNDIYHLIFSHYIIIDYNTIPYNTFIRNNTSST